MAGGWTRVLVLAGFLTACSDDASKIDYDSPPGDSAEATEEDAERQPGDDCNNGDGVLDCDLNCWEADVTRLLGDGDCDQGEGGPNFDCAELDLDDGDCEDDGEDDASGDETGGTSTGGVADAGGSTGEGTSGETDAGGSGTTGSGTTGSGTTGSGTGGTSGSGTSGGSGVATGGGSGGTPPGGDGGTATPGMDCRTGYFFDCALECVMDSYRDWVGDSYCDTPYPVDLDCEEFEYDGGDCIEPEPEPEVEPEPEPEPVVGGECGDDRIYDCSLVCVSASLATAWEGDGFCEDGTAYEGAYDLDCIDFDFDGGDCAESDDLDLDADGTSDVDDPVEDPVEDPVPVEPVPGEACGTDRVYDCAGTCVDASTAEAWAIDTFCDGEDATYGYHLDCAAFGYDDRACDLYEDTGAF